MRILKITVAIIVLTIIVLLIAALFLPNEIVISQKTLINSTSQVVFRQVNSMENYAKWSPFEEDETMINTYEGPDAGVGAKRSWKGDKVGEGSMTISASTPYSLIQKSIEFGAQGKAIETWNFEDTAGFTRVVWTTKIYDLTYPIGRLFGVMMDDMMLTAQLKGLRKLKELSESLPFPPKVEIVDVQGAQAIIIYDSTTINGIGQMLENNYGQLMDFIAKKKITIVGNPFAIYHNWDPQGYIKISAGFPVDQQVETKDPVSKYEFAGGKAIFTQHTGGFNTSATHEAIDEYIKDFNLRVDNYIWEVYETDPNVEPDSTKWITSIYYPIIE